MNDHYNGTTVDIADSTRPRSAGRKIRSGVSGFLHDTLELIELQGVLLREDVSRAKSSIILGGICLGATALLGLSVVTVLLFAAGSGIADLMEWPGWAGHLAAAGAALLALLMTAGVGAWLLIRATRPLGRSADELKANWTAVRAAVSRGPVDDSQEYADRLQAYDQTRDRR